MGQLVNILLAIDKAHKPVNRNYKYGKYWTCDYDIGPLFYSYMWGGEGMHTHSKMYNDPAGSTTVIAN